MNNSSAPHLNIPKTRINTIAKWISDIINPVFGGIFVIGLMVYRILPTPKEALIWLTISVAVTAIPTMLYVLHLVKIGYLEDIYMPDRARRMKPIAVIMGWLLISLGILNFIGAPKAMLYLLVAVIAQVTLLGIITPLWKISFHGATIMAVAVITALLPDKIAWLLFALVPVVGWTRVQLHRHTVMQVLAGYVAGIVVAVPAFYLIKLYIPF